ncbi:LuxR C-terminal-related transcriptional regulator [Arthrobacter sp. JSM 101049]|uniref:helix-turn-helix transcriptional regulator n=1 Tax=Arthrobacter sp. JSM 101049 TaxID=929097 RepID=UPI00356823FF
MSNAKVQTAGETPTRHAEREHPAALTKHAAELRAHLAEGATGGAIVVGRSGSGRRVAIEEALAHLPAPAKVVHLSGSAYAARMRHGALTFLLSQLTANQQGASRHELVHGLARLLCPEGKRTIITLGSPTLIDAESAAILAQLAAMRKIALVAVCERLADLPEDMLALHRSGQLPRVTVPSMNLIETRTFLEAEIGGPISIFAAAALWHLTHSNRDLLHELVRDLVADGKLTLEDGCWVFAPGSIRFGPALMAYRARALAGLDHGERCLLRALAIGGPVTAAELRRADLVDDLAGLRSRELVTVGEAPVGSIGITVPILGHMLRDMEDEHQEEVDQTTARLHADEHASRILTEVRGMQELGNQEALVAVVDDFADCGGFSTEAWQADAVRQAAILKTGVETLCALGERKRAEKRLSRATAQLMAALQEHPDEAQLNRAAQLLHVKSARIALLDTHAEAVPDLLATATRAAHANPSTAVATSDGRTRPIEGTTVGTVWETEALHFKALAVEAEAWAMTARQREAVLVVQRILSDIEGLQLTGVLDQVMTPSDCADIECTLLRVQLLAGEWQSAAEAAAGLAAGRYADPRSIAYGELVAGLLKALSGEADAALGMLLPSLHQLTASVDAAELAVVEAAIAYCMADQERNSEAVELLLRSPRITERDMPLTFFSWAAEIFSSLAVARMDNSQAAAVRLMALADKARDHGTTTLEMNSLALALRFGRSDVASRLGSLCNSAPGPAASGFLSLSRGTLESDPSLIAQGLEELADHGLMLYAVEDGNALFSALGHKDRRRVFAAMVRSRDDRGPGTATESVPAGHADDKPAWLDQLTKREAQVAQRVIAGMSNSDIARLSGVSVRTVEGHLYQVYSKLQVRNRQELTSLDRASRGTVEAR